MSTLRMIRVLGVLLLMALVTPGVACSGDVTIVDATAVAQGPGVYRFDVTLRHADSGWDHYADGWDVRAPDGTVLGHRTLVHPHVNEQPFTRSLGGVAVPNGLSTVMVHAHDKVHGWGSEPFAVALP